MYSNLKDLGIKNVSVIEKYTLREEASNDILKIYFKRKANDFLAKSMKFKFKRQSKKATGGAGTAHFTQVSQINSTLFKVVKELDSLSIKVKDEKEIKQQILADLRHLEKTVTGKIKDIEAKLDLL